MARIGLRHLRHSYEPHPRRPDDYALKEIDLEWQDGGTYALLGIGLTLIFGIMRVVNFTHGELYAFGAYCMYALVMPLGMAIVGLSCTDAMVMSSARCAMA